MKGNGVDHASNYLDVILTATGSVVWLIIACRSVRWLLDLPHELWWLLWGNRRVMRAYKERTRRWLAAAKAADEAKRLRRASRSRRGAVTALEAELLGLPEEEAASRAAALPRKRAAASPRPADPRRTGQHAEGMGSAVVNGAAVGHEDGVAAVRRPWWQFGNRE